MTDKPNITEEPNEEKDGLYEVFDDLRESLAEDEQEDQSSDGKKKGFFKRLRRSKKSKKKDEQAPEPAEQDENIEEVSVDAESDDALEERLNAEYIEDTLTDEDLLDEEDLLDYEEEIDEEDVEAPEIEEPAPRLSETLETDADHIRDIALEEYTEEELEEVDERKRAWKDFVQAPTSQMGKIEWLAIAFVGLIVGGLIIWFGIQANGGLRSLSEPPPTRTPDPNVPIPTHVQLPGGWSFRLGKGSLNTEGQWEPYGAEWLQGTEICKWIALPWSTQLEAVIRTLEAGDEIEVTMSNYDVLTYHVYSRKQVDSTQAAELNQDVPSVLLILSSEDSDQKWVLTAVLDYENIE